VKTRNCPLCGCESSLVIYYGLPHKLCPACFCLHGFWAGLTGRLPFNGMFLEYRPGRYWRALWIWIKGIR